jgi:hypothetical protein
MDRIERPQIMWTENPSCLKDSVVDPYQPDGAQDRTSTAQSVITFEQDGAQHLGAG